MSPGGAARAQQPLWTVRQARWLLVGVHIPFVVFAPISSLADFFMEGAGHPAVVLPLGAAMAALQLRHSLASARGEWPRWWPLTFLALVVLAYLPRQWLGQNWTVAQWFVLASAVMLLRPPRLSAVVVTAIVIGSTTVEAFHEAELEGHTLTTIGWVIAYHVLILITGPAVLYGSALLVRVAEELYATRVELAQVAVGRERLRLSRDLHDLLGQSLSAVSLKGDLARRLIHRDLPAACAEIEGLTEVARDALRDMHAVTLDEHAVSLPSEAASATALLAAAGIDAKIDVDLPDLAPGVEGVLAWATREGVTNLLRHSEARSCSITAIRRDGMAQLEIVNDRARSVGAQGGGLAGLTERAGALSGSVSTERLEDGDFRLVVQIPEG